MEAVQDAVKKERLRLSRQKDELSTLLESYCLRVNLCKKELEACRDRYQRMKKSAEELSVKIMERESYSEHSQFVLELEQKRLEFKRAHMNLFKQQVDFYDEKIASIKHRSACLACPNCGPYNYHQVSSAK